jgi:histidinol-phosphate aminotransferase
MATFIEQLANTPSANNPDHKAKKKLVPPHVESLQAYQPGRPAGIISKENAGQTIINLASNENTAGPPASALKAIVDSLSSLHKYPEFGALKLREALAEKHKVGVNNIVVGSGSESILANILRAFLHGDDEVLTSHGTFIGVRVLVQGQGVKLNTVPLKNYSFDLDAIADAVNERTKMIYLCNPNNPTGTIFTRPDFERFMSRVPEHVLIILDEAYYEFASHAEVFPDSLHYRIDNVLTLRTFAKAYAMAGVRLGYGIGHDYLVDFVNRIKLPFEPNCLAQAAGLAALSDHEFLRKTKENNLAQMQIVSMAFDRLGVRQVPSHGNFIMVDLSREKAVQDVHESLLNKGVAVRPLKAFGLPTCFRVTIGQPHENEIFINAFAQTIKELQL